MSTLEHEEKEVSVQSLFQLPDLIHAKDKAQITLFHHLLDKDEKWFQAWMTAMDQSLTRYKTSKTRYRPHTVTNIVQSGSTCMQTGYAAPKAEITYSEGAKEYQMHLPLDSSAVHMQTNEVLMVDLLPRDTIYAQATLCEKLKGNERDSIYTPAARVFYTSESLGFHDNAIDIWVSIYLLYVYIMRQAYKSCLCPLMKPFSDTGLRRDAISETEVNTLVQFIQYHKLDIIGLCDTTEEMHTLLEAKLEGYEVHVGQGGKHPSCILTKNETVEPYRGRRKLHQLQSMCTGSSG